MTDMYKKNGLKPVNFPTPPTNDIILQAYREVFTDTCEDETETNDNVKDNDDLTPRMTDDSVGTAKNNRQKDRGSLSLLPIRMEKRKKTKVWKLQKRNATVRKCLKGIGEKGVLNPKPIPDQ